MDGLDLVVCPLRLLLVSGGHDDVGARPGQGLCGLEPEATVGSGDDGGPAGQVGDVGGGPGHGGVPL